MKRRLCWAPRMNKDARNIDCQTFSRLLDTPKWKTVLKTIKKHGGKDVVASQLPVLYPSVAEFGKEPKGKAKTNHTANNIVEMSGLFMTDYDKTENEDVENWRQWYEDHLKGREEELGIVFVHESIAQHGIHTFAMLPEGADIAEAQHEQAEQLGLVCDKACKDPSRASFAVPRQMVLYDRMDQWFAGAEILPMKFNPEKHMEKKTENCNMKIEKIGEVSIPNPSDPNKKYPTEYDGIPYSKIIERYWENSEEGFPKKGTRHNRTFELFCLLRTICENNPEWLLQVVPNYEEDENAWRRSAYDACKKDNTYVNHRIRSIVNELKAEMLEKENEGMSPLWQEEFNDLLPRMPLALRGCIEKEEEKFRIPILMLVMAAAATYVDGKTYDYVTGNDPQPFILWTLIVGEPHSGKHHLMSIVDIWTEKLKQEGKPWEEELNKWLAKTKKGIRPDFGKIHRHLAASQTLANMNLDFRDNQGHSCIITEEEADTLMTKLGSEFKALLKKAYDASEHKVGRGSAEGASVNVRPMLCLALETQPVHAKTWLGGSSKEDGLEDRFMIVPLKSGVFDKTPKYPKMSKETRKAIEEAIERLENMPDEIETPLLNKTIEDWLEEKRLEAEKNNNIVWGKARVRAAVNAWRASIVYMGIEGKGETEEVLAFANMLADYLWTSNVAAQEQWFNYENKVAPLNLNAVSLGNRVNWTQVYSQLPNPFTYKDLEQQAPDSNSSSRKQIIREWKKKEWIDSGVGTKNKTFSKLK